MAAKAHPGDTLTVSELFRLCRDLIDIHNVRGWCQARGVTLRSCPARCRTSRTSPPRRHHRPDHQCDQRRRPIPARLAERTHR
ncbi:recombinase family protein [Nonomuraea montanisoli]|uniref:recombinase family protein n=1 Tax=Nonomuraea montanisoli TaxID=2741721 RepID=UPI0038B40832